MPRAFRQFGLRTLLISLTLLGVVLGIWRGVVDPIHRQHAAAAKLTEKGARIEWAVRGPDWLRKWAGEYYVNEVVEVDLRDKKLTDEDLAPLQQLRSLEWLSLRGNQVTDEGQVHLAGLEDLQGLDIRENGALTEEGLVHLGGLPKLSYLAHGIVVGDEGLKYLAQLPALQVGQLRCRGVTADGFRHLRQLRGVEKLQIVAPQAEGWASMLRLDQGLRELTVREATMTDDEVAHIMSHDVLSHLTLDRVPVTDGVLPEIADSDELFRLILEETEVTLEGFLQQLGSRAPSIVVGVSIVALLNTEPKPTHFSWYGTVGPSDLAGLRHCRTANYIQVGQGFEGADLKALRELPALEHLRFGYSLGDADARVLSKLPALTSLTLLGPHDMTPVGLRLLGEAATLEALRMYMTPLSDEQWAAVGSLGQLKELSIEFSSIDSQETVHLKDLHRLEELKFWECEKIDNETLRHISTLRQLRELHLDDVPVDDQGLRHLHGMPNLKLVDLDDTNCTATGVKALEATLSEGAEISWHPEPDPLVW